MEKPKYNAIVSNVSNQVQKRETDTFLSLRPKSDEKLLTDDEVMTNQYLAQVAQSSGSQAMNEFKALYFKKALKKFKITVKEASDAFWKAYADPYKKGNEIEFAHIWKYVEEMRKVEPQNIKVYSYNEAMGIAHKAGMVITDMFECLNGENGTERKEIGGKLAWRKISH